MVVGRIRQYKARQAHVSLPPDVRVSMQHVGMEIGIHGNSDGVHVLSMYTCKCTDVHGQQCVGVHGSTWRTIVCGCNEVVFTSPTP